MVVESSRSDPLRYDLSTAMSQASPESRKVNEFLDSVSQLSQERIRDSHKTQRDLQRDVDKLRGSRPPLPLRPGMAHQGISELKFNRSGESKRLHLYESWKEPHRPDLELAPPSLPKRPEIQKTEERNPPLPTRPKPTVPQKPILLPQRPQEVVIDIPNVRVRKESKEEKKTFIVPPRTQGTSGPPGIRSFSQMEESIRSAKHANLEGRNRPEKSTELGNKSVHEAASGNQEVLRSEDIPNYKVKPAVKPKPEVKLKAGIKSTESTANDVEQLSAKTATQNGIPARISLDHATLQKPVIGLKPAAASNQAVSKHLGLASSTTSKPPVPKKTMFKTYETQDSEALRNQILRLSPTKNERKPSSTFDKGVLLAASKPAKPLKPAKLDSGKGSENLKESNPQPEALLALGKLKKTAPKLAPKPTQRHSNLTNSPQPKSVSPPAPSMSDSSNSTDPKLSFQAQLSSLLRSSTEPALLKSAPKVEVMKRALTENDEQAGSAKLVHTTKSRARGPKRRLPTNIKALAQRQSKGSDSSEVRKKPPPIKPKKNQSINVRPRAVSGELFI